MDRNNILNQLHELEQEVHTTLECIKVELLFMALQNTSDEEMANCMNMRFDDLRNTFNSKLSLILDEYDRENKSLETKLNDALDGKLEFKDGVRDPEYVTKGYIDLINIEMERLDKEKEAVNSLNITINNMIDNFKNDITNFI